MHICVAGISSRNTLSQLACQQPILNAFGAFEFWDSRSELPQGNPDSNSPISGLGKFTGIVLVKERFIIGG